MISLIITGLLACSGGSQTAPEAPTPEAVAPAPEAPAAPPAKPPAEARCSIQPPANDAPWTAALPADALPGFSDIPHCAAVLGDFDRDGKEDTALLEANYTTRQARLRFVMGSGEQHIARIWPTVPEALGKGVVPTFIIPKPASTDVARDNISAEAKAALTGRDAIETCHGEEGEALTTADLGDLCYCSGFWIVEDGAPKSVLVCD